MGKLTAKQVIAYSKADPKKYSDGEGLYFCVRKQGSPYWMIRYTTAKGRREATLGQFPLMSLADARIAAAYFRKEVRDGIDPLLEKQKIELPDIETVDQLFHDWYRTDLSRRLKHPKIPYRVYTKDISPVIGIKCIAEVTARDVREVLERIRESNRPTIANDTLMYMKQLFRHAIKLDLTLNNPAAAFTVDDAGGVESSKDRMLSKEEIHYAFSVFHTHINSFGRDNYLWMGVGFVLVLIGMLLMSGGAMPSPDVWDESLIYSSRRTVLAPIVILAGLAVEVYAIFKK